MSRDGWNCPATLRRTALPATHRAFTCPATCFGCLCTYAATLHTRRTPPAHAHKTALRSTLNFSLRTPSHYITNMPLLTSRAALNAACTRCARHAAGQGRYWLFLTPVHGLWSLLWSSSVWFILWHSVCHYQFTFCIPHTHMNICPCLAGQPASLPLYRYLPPYSLPLTDDCPHYCVYPATLVPHTSSGHSLLPHHSWTHYPTHASRKKRTAGTCRLNPTGTVQTPDITDPTREDPCYRRTTPIRAGAAPTGIFFRPDYLAYCLTASGRCLVLQFTIIVLHLGSGACLVCYLVTDQTYAIRVCKSWVPSLFVRAGCMDWAVSVCRFTPLD